MAPRPVHLIKSDTLRRLTSYASVAVAGVLIAAKCAAYYYTDSVALLSSLVDSGVDLLASLITAYGVHIALKPADHDHRYGHGKAESLAALAQAVFILASSVVLVKEAVGRFKSPLPIQNLGIGYAVMGLAIVLTLGLLALQTYTVKRTKSLAIASDRLHYVGDVLINLAVVATFLAQNYFEVSWVDPLFALAIAGGMCVGAVKISRMALKVLMDAELPDADRQKILSLARNVDGVHDVHDLRTRMDIGRSIIELHVEMDPNMSLKDAHAITDAVARAIEAVYQKADILIHQDPVGVEEDRLDVVIGEKHKHV